MQGYTQSKNGSVQVSCRLSLHFHKATSFAVSGFSLTSQVLGLGFLFYDDPFCQKPPSASHCVVLGMPARKQFGQPRKPQGVGTGCTRCLQLFCTARIAPPTYTSHHTLHTSHPATLRGLGGEKLRNIAFFSTWTDKPYCKETTTTKHTTKHTTPLSLPPKREQQPVNSMGPFNSICLTGFLITFEIDSDLT